MDPNIPEDTKIPENKDPQFIGDTFQTVLGFCQQYGWILVLSLGVLFYLYSRLKPWLHQWTQQAQSDAYKKMDAGVVQDRLEAMDRARAQLQAKYNEEAKQHAERQRQREEENRQKRMEEYNRMTGYTGKAKKPPAEAANAPKPSSSSSSAMNARKPLRPEYNPLMGSGSSGSACFRPGRRAGPSGGG